MALSFSGPRSVDEETRKRRADILRWLRTDSRPLADLFETTVHLLDAAPFPGAGRFICHGAREIGNRLAGFKADGPLISGRVKYPDLVSSIHTSWVDAGLPLGNDSFPVIITETEPGAEERVEVPAPTARTVARLLAAHKAADQRQHDRAAILLDTLNRQVGGIRGNGEAAIDRWRKLCDWFAGHCHLPDNLEQAAVDVPLQELRTKWHEFEEMLRSMSANFFDIVDEVDADMLKEPTAQVVETMMRRFPRVAVSQYFFGKLADPAWLEPLDRAGCFATPPQVVVQPDGVAVSFGLWHEGEFLLRMVAHHPHEVLAIVGRIPPSDNPRVNHTIARIAIELPPDLSATLADRIRASMADDRFIVIAERTLWELIKKLAGNGQFPTAKEFTFRLFGVRAAGAPDPENEWSRLSSIVTVQELWHYREGLRQCMPALIAADGPGAVQILGGLLINTLKLARLFATDVDPFDHSLRYGERIHELHDDMASVDVQSVLPGAVVSAALEAIRLGSPPDAVMGQLTRLKPVAFRAIEMRVLARAKFEAPAVVKEHLLNFSFLAEPETEDAYGALLAARFGELAKSDRQSVLERIAVGPNDDERFIAAYTLSAGTGPTPEWMEVHRQSWTRKRLRWISAEFLPPDMGALLERLNASLAPYENQQQATYGFPESLRTTDELRALSPIEVAEFIRNWVYDPNVPNTNVRGLAAALQPTVDQRAAEFSAIADQFVGLHQTYVRHVFWAFANAAKRAVPLNWQKVLDLCAWAVSQEREDPPGDRFAFEEMGWRETRRGIADLISDGLQQLAKGIPGDCRERTWSILSELAKDADPAPDRDIVLGQRPEDRSIGSVRGMAMHAVVRYGIWVRHQLGTDSDGPVEFDAMPEVRELLDAHLDPAIDGSLSVRSVYGQFFPWLVSFDPAWAAASSNRIFPDFTEYRPYWLAAWNAYLRFGGAYDDTFHVLRPKYATAVGLLDATVGGPAQRDDEERLGAHLLAYYWRGRVELSDGSVLGQFFQRASDYGRHKALSFVGRSMMSDRGSMAAEVADRLRDLFDLRVQVAAADGGQPYRAELTAFGAWFASGMLDEAWSIATLQRVLDLAGKVEMSNLVITRLAALSPSHPEQAIRCLRLIVDDRQDGYYEIVREAVATILSIAIGSGIDEARDLAIDTVHVLGERGDMNFQKLLPRA